MYLRRIRLQMLTCNMCEVVSLHATYTRTCEVVDRPKTRSHSNRSNHRMNASATLLDRVVQTPAPPACTPTLTCCRRSTTTTIIKASSLFSLLRALFLPLYTNTQASKPSLSLVNTIQISLSLSVSLSHWEQCFFL